MNSLPSAKKKKIKMMILLSLSLSPFVKYSDLLFRSQKPRDTVPTIIAIDIDIVAVIYRRNHRHRHSPPLTFVVIIVIVIVGVIVIVPPVGTWDRAFVRTFRLGSSLFYFFWSRKHTAAVYKLLQHKQQHLCKSNKSRQQQNHCGSRETHFKWSNEISDREM